MILTASVVIHLFNVPSSCPCVHNSTSVEPALKSSVLICISSTCPYMYTLPVYPKTNRQTPGCSAPACMCCNVRRASAGGAVQVPERHQQPTGRARLAPQQSQEVHRRQEPRPGLRTGRTGVSKFASCIHYVQMRCSFLFLFFCIESSINALHLRLCSPPLRASVPRSTRS